MSFWNVASDKLMAAPTLPTSPGSERTTALGVGVDRSAMQKTPMVLLSIFWTVTDRNRSP